MRQLQRHPNHDDINPTKKPRLTLSSSKPLDARTTLKIELMCGFRRKCYYKCASSGCHRLWIIPFYVFRGLEIQKLARYNRLEECLPSNVDPPLPNKDRRRGRSSSLLSLNSSEKTSNIWELSLMEVFMYASFGVSRSTRPKLPIEGTFENELSRHEPPIGGLVITWPDEFVVPRLNPTLD